MDEYGRRQRVAELLERGERIRWSGTSARMAYLPGHIPVVLLMTLFCAGIAGLARSGSEAILSGEITASIAFRMIFVLVIGWFAYMTVRSVIHDLHVDWVITDRRIYRISGGSVVLSEIRSAASVEITRRSDARGSIVVNMPEIRDADGDRHHPSVAMLGIEGVDQAYAAIRSAQTTDHRTI